MCETAQCLHVTGYFLVTAGYRYCGQRDNGSLEMLKFAVEVGGLLVYWMVFNERFSWHDMKEKFNFRDIFTTTIRKIRVLKRKFCETILFPIKHQNFISNLLML